MLISKNGRTSNKRKFLRKIRNVVTEIIPIEIKK